MYITVLYSATLLRNITASTKKIHLLVVFLVLIENPFSQELSNYTHHIKISELSVRVQYSKLC